MRTSIFLSAIIASLFISTAAFSQHHHYNSCEPVVYIPAHVSHVIHDYYGYYDWVNTTVINHRKGDHFKVTLQRGRTTVKLTLNHHGQILSKTVINRGGYVCEPAPVYQTYSKQKVKNQKSYRDEPQLVTRGTGYPSRRR